MTTTQDKVDQAAQSIEDMRSTLLGYARSLDAQAEALADEPRAHYIVAGLRKAARDTLLTANSLPAFGLRSTA